METIWYAVLGLFFAAYLVLGGYDYGVGLLLPRAGGPAGRRAALNAVGPFFLGNEVWLVAAVGILFGAFPVLEGKLLSGLYGLVVAALLGVVGVTAAVQLRSRARGRRARTGWDSVIVGSSALAAAGWGAVLGGWLQGTGGLATPFVVLCAVALLALVATHGAAFLALRLPASEPAAVSKPASASGPTSTSTSGGDAATAARFAKTGTRLAPLALVAIGAATVAGVASAPVRDAVQNPLACVLVLVALAAALVTGWVALARRRTALGFAATALSLVLPVLLVFASLYPYALPPSLTVAEAVAAPGTLRILNWLALPLLPALIGFQAMCWWAFRGRLDHNAPVFY